VSEQTAEQAIGQDEVALLHDTNANLVAYLENYQRMLTEADFAKVQAERSVEKLSEAVGILQRELTGARQRIAELETINADVPEKGPEEAPEDAPAPRKRATRQ
jgi:uncharacterized protein (DUF2164 family)